MTLIKFYGYYREKIGENSIKVRGAYTLEELLEKLKEALKEKKEILFEDGKLKRNILLAVNDDLVSLDNIAEVYISDKDTVSVMPLPSGG
ncbi:MAG: hypothetical protein B6U95_09330 [Thermofilum sp. ex4484_82]|nr:MAG: hypothetical protein B6U95_09330 [Thermofilum sp. ex4484_82]OYT35866.1 MAG: hypothetical protein B6U96_09340 [Archaeoglobales archaeon ex4484_92]